MDASNMLKPALARGTLRCVWATTLNEYRKYIEKDAALERRFQPVLVKEPTVDFKNTLVIMTSNTGSQWIQDLAVAKRQEMEQRVTEALRVKFKPEFLNRIGETIIFQNLVPEQLAEIVKIQVAKLRGRLAVKNIGLELSTAAVALIAEKGYDPVYGARPLKRVIQQYLENPLSMEILKGNIAEGARIMAGVEGRQIVFNSIK